MEALVYLGRAYRCQWATMGCLGVACALGALEVARWGATILTLGPTIASCAALALVGATVAMVRRHRLRIARVGGMLATIMTGGMAFIGVPIISSFTCTTLTVNIGGTAATQSALRLSALGYTGWALCIVAATVLSIMHTMSVNRAVKTDRAPVRLRGL